MNIDFTQFPIIETERLVLRKPNTGDIDEMFRYRSDKAFMQYIPHRYATKREEVEKMMGIILQLIDNNEGINWAITQKGDDTIMGLVGYVRFNKDHFRAEIGYMLHTPYQGKGILTEAAQAVVDYGFETLGLHSIEAIINSENTASQGVVERLGFTRDAFFRDYLHHGGQFMDAYVYSLLEPSAR
jgi:[ribosomal protein S5]-alanine N-acetyltransferase